MISGPEQPSAAAQRCAGAELDVYLSREKTERQILVAYGSRSQREEFW